MCLVLKHLKAEKMINNVKKGLKINKELVGIKPHHFSPSKRQRSKIYNQYSGQKVQTDIVIFETS